MQAAADGAIQITRHAKRRGYIVLGLLGLALIYPRHDWGHYFNVNETARIYLVQAVVDHHVFHINDEIRKDGDVLDKAELAGHYYCDKPIGLSMLAVPVYALLKLFGGSHEWSQGALRYLLTVICVSLPSLWAAWRLRDYWQALSGSALLADLSTLALGLGTIAYPYSTQFMGHQLAAVIAVAHFLISRRLAAGPVRPRDLVLAGLLAGLGAITEYYSALIHLIIAAGYLPRLRPRTQLLAWLAPAAAMCVPLLIYNAVCIGGPFQLGYSHEALESFSEQHSTGFMGVTYPRPESIWGLSFSASKGLFYFCPELIFAVFGAVAGLRDRALRRDTLSHLSSVLVICLLAMSVLEWRAGWTIGPRHMVSMLPFMMSLVVIGVSKRPALIPWFAALALLGMTFNFAATLTLPAFEVHFENPLASQALFLLRRGLVTANLGMLLHLGGVWSLVPLILAMAAVLCMLATDALRLADRQARRMLVGSSILAAGWSLAVATYEPDHPALLALFQGRILGLVDQLPEGARLMERAIDLYPSKIICDEAVPHLMVTYRELGDAQSARRLAERVKQIERAEASSPGR